MRGYLLDSKLHKPKGASSKSPAQKKGAFEFASNGLKSDESSQNSPIKESTNNQKKEKEKMRAFHREIEKRYNASESNQNYIFPRKQSQSFSLNSSLESLKDVITYNLHSVGNMVKAIKEEKRRGSTENSLGVSLTSSGRPSTRQIQTAREAFNESIRFSNKKTRKRELGSQTSRGQTLEKRMLNSSEKTQPKKEKRKRLKLSISQSRKALLQGNNSTKQTDSVVENTTTLQTKVKKHSSKRSHAELLAKTISLNVNENNNFGQEIKTAKNTKRQLDIKTNNLMSSFFPKMLSTKSSKDLHCYSSKYPSHTTNFFKASVGKAEVSSNKGAVNAMLSTMSSLPDKSLMSLKSSYSVFQNDPEKMNKSKTKLMNLRSTLETSENHSSLLSFNPIPAEVPSTSRGASKSRGGKTKTNSLYQKTREDLMNRLRSSSGNKNHKSPALSPLRDLVRAPLTTRARENTDEMMTFIKKKIQSPRFEMSLFKAIGGGGGHTPLQKSLSIVRSAKDLHKIDKEKDKKPSSKVAAQKSIKLKETKERSKVVGGDSKKPHLHIDLQKSCQFDKSKMKLNLQGLTQRVAPLSERGALTDDRSMMNKQHYSQTAADYLK